MFHNNIRQITILSSKVEPPTPILTSAIFSTTGSSITATFDSPTNMAINGTPNKKFMCNTVLLFINADKSVCQWIDSSNILIFPYYLRQLMRYNGINEYNILSSTTTTALQTGSIISIKNSTIKAECTIISCTTWKYSTSTVIVTASPNGISPALVISAPTILGGCDDFIMDLTSSTNDGGRPWKSLTLEIKSNIASQSSLDAIQSFILTKYMLSLIHI